jgi:hypothetical protein
MIREMWAMPLKWKLVVVAALIECAVGVWVALR